MPPTSLNFPNIQAYPQVNAWGADAEALLADRPDLALVRCRQLAELFARASAQRFGTGRQVDLSAYLRSLKRHLPRQVHTDLHHARDRGNDAVHVSGLAVPGPGAWRHDARRAVLGMARAWCWFANKELPSRLRALPSQPEAAPREELAALLDDAEEQVEAFRDSPAAETLLARVEQRLSDKALTDVDRDYLSLRVSSIRLAASNHAGALSPEARDDRSRRLMASGDAEAIDALVHYHNRLAVRDLNRLDYRGAQQVLEPLLDWRRARQELAPEHFGGIEMRDWQRGALLGTLGQTLAIQGHAQRDPKPLRQALDLFAEASRMFVNDDDIVRQRVYRLETLCEILRLGGSLLDSETEELAAVIDEPLPEEFLAEPFHTSAFRVAVALKAARLLNTRPKWATRVADHLASAEGPLDHPYERIAAGLGLMLEHATPRRLRARLDATAKAEGLIGWLASVHVAGLEGGDVPRCPEFLDGWWSEHDMGEAGALLVLPLNWGV